MVRAYHLYMNGGMAGDLYNINGNAVLSMQEILEMLRTLTTIHFDVAVDQARFRPTDVQRLQPVCTPFKERFAWEPSTPYIQSLTDLLNYWRARV